MSYSDLIQKMYFKEVILIAIFVYQTQILNAYAITFSLAMIAVIVLLNMFAAKLKIAYPILLVVGGLVISFIPGLPVIKIDPDLIFFIFLPPLLFEAAWSISFKEMKKWWRIIGSFAFGGFLYGIVGSFGNKSFYSRIYYCFGVFTWRNSVSARCCKYRSNHKICENSKINFHDSGRRKSFE